MQTPAKFISFADGRCRHLRARDVDGQIDEAIQACCATNTSANLLDDKLKVVANVKYRPDAINQYVVVKPAA